MLNIYCEVSPSLHLLSSREQVEKFVWAAALCPLPSTNYLHNTADCIFADFSKRLLMAASSTRHCFLFLSISAVCASHVQAVGSFSGEKHLFAMSQTMLGVWSLLFFIYEKDTGEL